MSKIALILVKDIHIYWEVGYTFQPYSTEENGHELDQRAIRVWKYVRTGINAYSKNQVKNHPKIDNYVYNQKLKISKSIFSKAWKEKIDNTLSRHHEPNKLIMTIKYDYKYSRC